MKQIQELVMYTNTFTVDVCPNIFDYMLYKLYISTLNRCSLMKLQNLNVDGPTSTKLLSKRIPFRTLMENLPVNKYLAERNSPSTGLGPKCNPFDTHLICIYLHLERFESFIYMLVNQVDPA